MKTESTPGMDRAFERVLELAGNGDTTSYPNGTTFIGTDMPDFAKVLTRELLEGRPIAVFYPDGQERLIRPADPNGPVSFLARLLRRTRPR